MDNGKNSSMLWHDIRWEVVINWVENIKTESNQRHNEGQRSQDSGGSNHYDQLRDRHNYKHFIVDISDKQDLNEQITALISSSWNEFCVDTRHIRQHYQGHKSNINSQKKDCKGFLIFVAIKPKPNFVKEVN